MDQPETSTRAIVAFILAIVALPAISCFGCGGIALGVAALLVGISARRQIRESEGAQVGEGLARAAIIIGAIAAVLGLLLGIGLLVIPGLTLLAPGVQDVFDQIIQQLEMA
jgi:hypothetical protein